MSVQIVAFANLNVQLMLKPDTESGSKKWLELNNKYSEIWPNINKKKDPLEDQEKHKNEENKFEKYFKENV